VEVCGLLFGSDDAIEDAVPARNVAGDPARTFEVDPAALIGAYRAQRQGGPRLIGHYHSHPNGSATPSLRDGAAAEPGSLWLIIGGGVARLWRAREGTFTEVNLIFANLAPK
jgi:proteasome lid subunit RPN8/RPN11